ncbi:MAG: glycosyltransferase family 4 protein [Pseudomonadota bacterium]
MPKKYACIIYYTYFAYSALLTREATALRERGYEVDIICIRQPGDRPFEVVGGMNVFKIQQRRGNEGRAVSYLVKMLCFFGLCFSLVSYLHLRKGYDVVHVTSPPDFLVFAALLPRLTGARVILDIHDIVPELYMRKFQVGPNNIFIRALRRVERLACRFSHHVIIVTELWRRLLVSRGIPREKVTVIMNVPDPVVFDPRRHEVEKDGRYFTLVYHGTFGELFGVETLLRAMPKVLEQLPHARLFMWGNGPLRGRLDQIVRDLKLQERVKIACSMPFQDLPPRLAAADLGVVPTRGGVFAGKALSMKSLDYIAMRVPFVITRTPASSHYYDESMVEFFEPDDADGLAEAVVRLATDPRRRSEMVENCQRFYDHHNWWTYRHRYYEILGLEERGEPNVLPVG